MEHLGRRFVLRVKQMHKAITEIALHRDAQTGVLHIGEFSQRIYICGKKLAPLGELPGSATSICHCV